MINSEIKLELDNSDWSRCQLLFGKKLLFPDHFSMIAITALSDVYSQSKFALGAVKGPSGAVKGPSWAVKGPSGRQGAVGAIKGPSGQYEGHWGHWGHMGHMVPGEVFTPLGCTYFCQRGTLKP